MCNRNGSVIVDYSIWVDATITNKDVLREILANQTEFKIGAFAVDRDSITFPGKFVPMNTINSESYNSKHTNIKCSINQSILFFNATITNKYVLREFVFHQTDAKIDGSVVHSDRVTLPNINISMCIIKVVNRWINMIGSYVR